MGAAKITGAKLWSVVTIAVLLAPLVVACSSTGIRSLTPNVEEPEESAQPATSTDVQLEEPLLSATLKRNCQFNQPLIRNFDNAGLGIGETAVNFTLRDIYGSEYTLSGLLAEKPVMMVFGSFTCPFFRRRVVAIEEMQAKYGERVHFITIYTIEGYPVGSPSPYRGKEWTGPESTDKEGRSLTQPATYEERVTQATQMIQELGITVPVLIDEMDNPVWCTYGQASNIAYLIGTSGTVVEKQGWYQPLSMEAAIKSYLRDLKRPD